MCVREGEAAASAQATSVAAASERHFDKGRRVEGGGSSWMVGWDGGRGGAGKWQSQQMCNGHNFLNAQT